MPGSDDVLDVVLSHCRDPFTLLALSLTSKQFNSLCTSVVRQNFQQLLLAAAKSCAAASSYYGSNNETSRCFNTLRWLFGTAGTAAVAPDAMQLLRIRYIPADCIAFLVKAGAVPTWQQLVAAARSGYSMQYWLTACTQLNKSLAGMSVLAETALLVSNKSKLSPMAALFQVYSSIHYGDQGADLWQHVYQEQPTAAELLDVLLVGLSTQTASCLLSLLNSRGPVGQRQREQWLQQQRAVLRQLPDAAAKELIGAAVKHQSSRPMHDPTVHQLSNLLGRPELYGDVATAVAQQQLRAGADFLAYSTLREASAVLSAAHVCELLKAAAAAPEASNVRQLLFSLEVTSSLTTEQVCDVLLATVQHSAQVAEQLCKLPAAKQLSAEQVLDVFAAAVPKAPSSSSKTHSAACTLKMLVRKFGQKALVGQTTVLGWLHSAVQCDSHTAIEALSRLPAAEQLDAEQVAGLLTAAMQQGRVQAFYAVAEHFAKAEIGGDRLGELMTAAVHTDNTHAVEALRNMDA
jgi:hypothetical protein